jgi:hypothetical protein
MNSDQMVYVITATPGSGDAFLMAIIERIVRPDEQVPLWTSTHNNAFSATMRPGFDFDWNKHEVGPVPQEEFFKEIVITVPEDQPVIVSTNQLNPQAVLSRFPKAKIIAIKFDEDDLDEIARAHFWQLHVDEYNTQSRIMHENMKKNCPFLFTSPIEGTRPEDLTREEKLGFYALLKGLALLSGFSEVRIPEQYKNNVFLIDYKDLMKNPEKTLTTLSEILDATITSFVRTEYMNYLEKHRVFLESVD